MTVTQIENRVKKLKAIEARQQALDAEAQAIKDELKNDMSAKGTDELQTKSFVIRWKEVMTKRLDTQSLRATLPDIYNLYTRETTLKRFTIA